MGCCHAVTFASTGLCSTVWFAIAFPFAIISLPQWGKVSLKPLDSLEIASELLLLFRIALMVTRGAAYMECCSACNISMLAPVVKLLIG